MPNKLSPCKKSFKLTRNTKLKFHHLLVFRTWYDLQTICCLAVNSSMTNVHPWNQSQWCVSCFQTFPPTCLLVKQIETPNLLNNHRWNSWNSTVLLMLTSFIFCWGLFVRCVNLKMLSVVRKIDNFIAILSPFYVTHNCSPPNKEGANKTAWNIFRYACIDINLHSFVLCRIFDSIESENSCYANSTLKNLFNNPSHAIEPI